MGDNSSTDGIQDDNIQRIWDQSASTQSQFHLLGQMAKCTEFLPVSPSSVPHEHTDFRVRTYGRFFGGEKKFCIFTPSVLTKSL